MATKIGPWICDTCGEEILEAERGWVEWLTTKEGEGWRAHGLRLVHHNSSHREPYQYRERDLPQGTHQSDSGLHRFLGDEGLMYLLSLTGRSKGMDPAEVIEMVKRLHVPGYDQARPFFERAIADEIIEPSYPAGFYTQKEIWTTIEFSESL